MAYHRHHGVDVRIVRIFNTYGPYMRVDDGRSVSNFLVQALRGEPITVFGDGSQTRSFCYVDDEVRGFLALLDADVTGPDQHRQPERVHDPPARRAGRRGHRLVVDDHVRAAARSTTRRSASPTSRWPAGTSAGSRRSRCATGLERTAEYFAPRPRHGLTPDRSARRDRPGAGPTSGPGARPPSWRGWPPGRRSWQGSRPAPPGGSDPRPDRSGSPAGRQPAGQIGAGRSRGGDVQEVRSPLQGTIVSLEVAARRRGAARRRAAPHRVDEDAPRRQAPTTPGASPTCTVAVGTAVMPGDLLVRLEPVDEPVDQPADVADEASTAAGRRRRRRARRPRRVDRAPPRRARRGPSRRRRPSSGPAPPHGAGERRRPRRRRARSSSTARSSSPPSDAGASSHDLIANTPADGLIGGIGTVNGDAVRARGARGAIAVSYDYTVLAGTQGLQNHRKKDRLFELAERLQPADRVLHRGRRRPARRHRRHRAVRARVPGVPVPRRAVRPRAARRRQRRLLLRRQRGDPRLLRRRHRHRGLEHRHGRPGDDRGRRARRVRADGDRADRGAAGQRRRRHRRRRRGRGASPSPSSTCRTSRAGWPTGSAPTRTLLRDVVPADRLRSYDVRKVDRAAVRHRLGARAAPRLRARDDHRPGPHRGPSGRRDRQQPDAPRRRHRHAGRRQGRPVHAAVRRVRPPDHHAVRHAGDDGRPRRRGDRARAPLQPAVRHRRQPHGADGHDRAAQGVRARRPGDDGRHDEGAAGLPGLADG